MRIPLWKLILTGVLSLVVTVALIVLWNISFSRYVGVGEASEAPGVRYWLLLSVGDVLLVAIAASIVWMFISTLRQARDLRRQHTFLDSVTHELKSPLTSLRLALETLLGRPVPDEMREQFYGRMINDVERLQTFIEHVLEAGRLQHKERELLRQNIDIDALLHQCLAQITQRHRVSDASFTLRVDTPVAGPVRVFADRVALEVILLNLIDNAVKYRGSNELKVEVSARLEGMTLYLTVTDLGRGIESAALRRIFGRFYRIPGLGVRGTGLGLYVVGELVRRMGGRIRAESDGIGKGATFFVQLPVEPAIPGDSTDEAELTP